MTRLSCIIDVFCNNWFKCLNEKGSSWVRAPAVHKPGASIGSGSILKGLGATASPSVVFERRLRPQVLYLCKRL